MGERQDLRVLVTGASSGIGAALARLLARRGATVGLVARRRDRLEEVLADCVATAPESRCWVADLADLDAAGAVARQVWDAFGHLDVVVNNAATPGVRGVTRLEPVEVEHVMRVNFHAPVRTTLAVLPRMLERGTGTVVNVSSLGGRLGIPNEAAYCASKFALCGWSESLALDLWGTGVTVKLVIPGPVDTEIWEAGDEHPAYEGPKVAPAEIAEGIAAAVGSDRFEHYLPDYKPVAEFKTADVDEYLARTVEALGGGPGA